MSIEVVRPLSTTNIPVASTVLVNTPINQPVTGVVYTSPISPSVSPVRPPPATSSPGACGPNPLQLSPGSSSRANANRNTASANSKIVEVIENLIREGGPQGRDDIIREVEKFWETVKDRYNRECRTTVITILSNWNGRFSRNADGNYVIKAEQAPEPVLEKRKLKPPGTRFSPSHDPTGIAAASLLEMHYSPDFSSHSPSLKNLPPELSLSCPRSPSPCPLDDDMAGLEDDVDVGKLVKSDLKTLLECSHCEEKEKSELKARHQMEMDKLKRKHRCDCLELQHRFEAKKRRIMDLYSQQKEAIAAVARRFQSARDEVIVNS